MSSETARTRTDETPDIIIPLIILLIFIAFLGWMSYLLISSGFMSTTPANPVASDRRVETTFACAPGQCATNLVSGFKTCPTDPNASINVNPAVSVCNGRFVCDNPLTPNALQSDLSTNLNGICEQGVECPCL